MTQPNPALVAFHTWAREAAYEAVFVYHKSRTELRPNLELEENDPLFFVEKDVARRDQALFTYASKLSEAGLAVLFQRKAGDEYEYCARRIHHETHFSLDRVSAAVKVRPSRAYRSEEGLIPTGRPPKRQEIAA